MYQIVFGNKFLKSAEKLDKQLKSKLKASLDILSKNPFNPALHTKSLSGKLSGYHSLDWAEIIALSLSLFPAKRFIY